MPPKLLIEQIKLFVKMTEREVLKLHCENFGLLVGPSDNVGKMGQQSVRPIWCKYEVRQGCILSPVLLKLYIDDLSKQLKACCTGCMIRNNRVNHLMYADDFVVLSPSSSGLQQLLTICSVNSADNDIKYNANKSAVLICRTKEDQTLNFPVFKLVDNNLEIFHEVKHLGHIITDKMTDDDNIYRQCCKMYAQAKIFACGSSLCSDVVKMSLFKAYCIPLSTAHSGANYKKVSMQRLQAASNDA